MAPPTLSKSAVRSLRRRALRLRRVGEQTPQCVELISVTTIVQDAPLRVHIHAPTPVVPLPRLPVSALSASTTPVCVAAVEDTEPALNFHESLTALREYTSMRVSCPSTHYAIKYAEQPVLALLPRPSV